MTRIRAALGAALALVLLVQPFATEAQDAGKVWRIGLISVAYLRIEDVFFQHLKGLGYVEGHRKDARSDFRNSRLSSLEPTSTSSSSPRHRRLSPSRTRPRRFPSS